MSVEQLIKVFLAANIIDLVQVLAAVHNHIRQQHKLADRLHCYTYYDV